MKIILITGGTGFIGQHVISELEKRDDVQIHSISRVPPKGLGANVTWHAVDLMDQSAVNQLMAQIKPSHLLHLAWDARPGKFWTSTDNLHWLAASIWLYEAFEKVGGKRFVGAGTCAEYDWSYNTLREGITPYAPSTLYGVSKNSLRMALEAASCLNDISFAWGHVFFLYGPNEPVGRLTSDAILNCLARKPMDTTHGRQLRDFLHVVDVARAFVALLESDVQGPVNIASGEAISVRDVLKKVEEVTGRTGLISFGRREMSPNEPMCMVADVEKLVVELEFKSQYSLKNGIVMAVKWWENAIANGPL